MSETKPSRKTKRPATPSPSEREREAAARELEKLARWVIRLRSAWAEYAESCRVNSAVAEHLAVVADEARRRARQMRDGHAR